MLDSSVGMKILDGIFGISKSSINFSGDIYIGLLTKLPNANGTKHDDGTYFSEPSDPTYLRIRLDTDSRINDKPFISDVKVDLIDFSSSQPRKPVYVTNQGLIIFPEASIDWDRVVGFGLFRTKDTTSEELPFLWGNVSSQIGEDDLENGELGEVQTVDYVEVKAEEVPIIRADGFKVSLA